MRQRGLGLPERLVGGQTAGLRLLLLERAREGLIGETQVHAGADLGVRLGEGGRGQAPEAHDERDHEGGDHQHASGEAHGFILPFLSVCYAG